MPEQGLDQFCHKMFQKHTIQVKAVKPTAKVTQQRLVNRLTIQAARADALMFPEAPGTQDSGGKVKVSEEDTSKKVKACGGASA